MGTFGKYNPLGGNGGISSIIANSPLSVSTMAGVSTLSISQAGAASSGYLSSTDWNTFNNKQPAGTYVTSVGATSPVASSGGTSPTISMPVATSSVDGYLSSSDWNTFNNKQPAGSYANTNLSNLAAPTALNQVLRGQDGSVSSPAYSFTSDTNTGVYRSAASTLSIAAQGFESLNITTAGLVVGANKSGNTSSIIFNTSSNSTYITNRTSGVDYQAIGIEAFGRSIQLGVTPLSSTCNVSIPYGKLTVSGVVENTNYVLSPQLYDAGTKTGNFTLDFANGPCQQVTINAAGPLVITLSNPVTGGAYLLKVVQGATPGTVTWPVAVKWGAAGAPVLSTVTGKIDIINLYYDGTNYYGTYALGF